MLELIFISVTSLIIGIILYHHWNKNKQKIKIQHEATTLLQQVRKVCKLITVEGDFQEIIDTRTEKSMLFDLVTQQKKAIVIVKAKALVGYDLSVLNINMNAEEKTIRISNFPEPKLISLETDINYYDITNRLLNRFSEKDLSELNLQAKQMVSKKVEESHLYQLAEEQALEIIHLISGIGQALGWTVLEELNQPNQKPEETPINIAQNRSN